MESRSTEQAFPVYRRVLERVGRCYLVLAVPVARDWRDLEL